DKCDHCRAVGHGPRFAHDLDPFFLQFFAGLICVGNADGQMAESAAQFVALGVPVVSELDDGVVLLVAVADERERELAAREILLTQKFHAKLFAIEVERLLQVSDSNHGVQQLHGIVLSSRPSRLRDRRNSLQPAYIPGMYCALNWVGTTLTRAVTNCSP